MSTVISDHDDLCELPAYRREAESHLWIALRYVELNPVRAALVSRAELWPWSSAAVHCGDPQEPRGLELQAWNQRWSKESWKEYLATGESQEEIDAIRHPSALCGRSSLYSSFHADPKKVLDILGVL